MKKAVSICIILSLSLFPAILSARKKKSAKSKKGELVLGGKTYKIETKISTEPGTKYYQVKGVKYCQGLVAVYIPNSYDHSTPMPLVMTSHGNGGNAAGEIGGWSGLANRHGFIVISPSFGLACLKESEKAADKIVIDMMQRVMSALEIDKRNVLATGFSGGGLPTYQVMMKHPEWFTAVCVRGPNFRGKIAKGSKWKNAYIYILWGEKDHPMICSPHGEGPAGLKALLRIKKQKTQWRKRKDKNSFLSTDKKFKWEIIPGGKHSGQNPRVAAWFAEQYKDKDKEE